MKSLSFFISEYLGKNNSSLTEKDILKIQYTLEVIWGDLIKFVILILSFGSLNELPLFFLSFVILISTRPLLGGIHCKTFNTCLMVSIIYFIIILLFSKLSEKININFYIFFFAISFVITFIYAPCANKKRPIKNRAILKRLSLISLTFWGILFFTITNIQICNCIFASIFSQIIQVIIINMKVGLFNAKIYKHFFSYTN